MTRYLLLLVILTSMASCAGRGGALSLEPHRILMGNRELKVPGSYVEDLRYFPQSQLVIFRAVNSGAFIGNSIGISFEELDGESYQALTEIGYSERESCGLRILERSGEDYESSTIIDLESGFVEFGDLPAREGALILESLCKKVTRTENGYRIEN